MGRCAGSVQHRSDSGKHALDHADFTAPIRHELYITQIRGLSGLEGLFLVGIGGLSDVRNMHIPFLKQDR